MIRSHDPGGFAFRPEPVVGHLGTHGETLAAQAVIKGMPGFFFGGIRCLLPSVQGAFRGQDSPSIGTNGLASVW